jgi:hypothetical protein
MFFKENKRGETEAGNPQRSTDRTKIRTVKRRSRRIFQDRAALWDGLLHRLVL